MKVIKYNKLIRDKIPEIIESSGKTAQFETMTDEEYLLAIDQKMDEELAEYHQDQTVEELADLMEVIYAAAKARGCSEDELNSIRDKKKEERGGFEKKLRLIEVREA